MIKLNITKISQDWLEATWIEEIATTSIVENVKELEDKVETTILHCESFSGHPEHIEMLTDRCTTFGTTLSEDDLKIIKEISEAFVMPTEEELEAQRLAKELAEQTAQRKVKMLEGDIYNGYLISFTKDDGDGLVQVKSAFELGLTSTVIYFENETKMPITAEEFPTFAVWFVERRDNFFKAV